MKYLEEVPMNLILGMDIGVFIAWIGTLLATVLCILYGLYYQFIKKSEEKQREAKPKEQDKTKEEDL
jgi:predicted outer membrane lipoprotein